MMSVYFGKIDMDVDNYYGVLVSAKMLSTCRIQIETMTKVCGLREWESR